jgi:hypothetical protein
VGAAVDLICFPSIDLILLALLLVSTALADHQIDDDDKSKYDDVDVVDGEAPQAANFMPLPMLMNRMPYSAMNNPLMMNIPQQAIAFYNEMQDEDFPIDYSMSCSNTCGCRQTCVMVNIL